jgi:hypothetical protein
MTKKFILILVGIALTIGVLGAAGYAYAQVTDSPETTTSDNEDLDDHPAFPGRRGGLWLGFGGDGLLHGYIFDEFAEIFNLSDEAIAAFQKVKETIMGIKDEYSAEEVREMMKEALTAAVSEALDDEAITQDQADKILERIENPGRFDKRRPNRGGRLGDFPGEDFGTRGEGLIGKYLEEALAEALGMTVDDFQTLKKEQGFNVADYAVEQGMTVEELQEWLRDVYTNAVNTALKDEVITQDQADKIMEQIENANGRMLLFPSNRHRRPGW